MKAATFFPLLALSTLIVLLAGCSTPATSGAMKADKLSTSTRHPYSVAVKTGGGAETNPMWTSQISDADLAKAIQESILANQLFTGVVSIGEADYVLHAAIFKLDQPMVGFTMEVGIEIIWSLTAKGATQPVWQKSIRTRVSKGVGDAMVGATRLRIATEASAQENIVQALNTIGGLSLPAGK